MDKRAQDEQEAIQLLKDTLENTKTVTKTVLFLGDSLKKSCLITMLLSSKVHFLEISMITLFLIVSSLYVKDTHPCVAEIVWVVSGIIFVLSVYNYFTDKRDIQEQIDNLDKD